MSSHDITRVKGRAALQPRREPYWHKISRHCYIGYRAGPGTWIARWTDESNGYEYRSLGEGDYDEIKTKAEVWFTECRGGVPKSVTVKDACERYVKDRRNIKGDDVADRADGMFANTVYETKLAQMKINEVRTVDLEDWRDSLVTKRRSQRSVNRHLRSLKAVLNFAFRRGLCPSDSVWRRVEALKGEGSVEQSRVVKLTTQQRAALLAECNDELANYLRALLYTGARPGAMVRAKVKDFDAIYGRVTTYTKKGTGQLRPIRTPLSTDAVAFFKKMTKDKLPNAPLISHDGEEWYRMAVSRGLREAIAKANAKITEPEDRLPTDTVAYTMRHCAIADRLEAGVSVGKVAHDVGTSVKMIEKHYAKFEREDVSERLNKITSF
jgi:integrase